MTEVMADPSQPPFWAAHLAGEDVDWAEVFADYRSQVDFPGAAVWHELSVAFPEARVIHTERPVEDWWASYSKTINTFWQHSDRLDLPPPIRAIFATMQPLIADGVFGGTDRETCVAAYRRNNEKVRDTIPADRLLVFTPSDGWEPLCRFLDVPAPATPFPKSNARDEFWALFGGEPVTA